MASKHELTNETLSNDKCMIYKDFVGEKEWFFLYWIAAFKNLCEGPFTTTEFISRIPLSQQTVSRRIGDLERDGYLRRESGAKGKELNLTAKAYAQLEKINQNLKILFDQEKVVETFQGELISGVGEGKHYIKHPKYLEQFYKKIGFFPYFGTLNLAIPPAEYELLINHLSDFQFVEIEGFQDESRTFGKVRCYKVILWPENNILHQITGSLLRIERTSHKPYILEFICEQYLRDFFQVKDKDHICFKFIKNPKIN